MDIHMKQAVISTSVTAAVITALIMTKNLDVLWLLALLIFIWSD